MNKRRDFRFSIRLSPEEKKKLDGVSQKQGEGYGSLMRRYLEEGVKRDTEKVLSEEERDLIYLHFEVMHYTRALFETLDPEVIAASSQIIKNNVKTYIEKYYGVHN